MEVLDRDRDNTTHNGGWPGLLVPGQIEGLLHTDIKIDKDSLSWFRDYDSG